MQLVRELENLNPFRKYPGKLPISYLLRNIFFDAVFYDLDHLDLSEGVDIVRRSVDFDEGGMLVVSPRAAGREIVYYDLSHDLVQEHPDLDAVALSGVGSSPLGTAALARQVADAHGAKVVGIIAGYGAADLWSEAMGGWIDFGMRNRVRAVIEAVRDRVPLLDAVSSRQAHATYKVLSDYLLVDEPESNTLLNILLRQGSALKLIVGHSKGALNIQNAAYGFDHDPRADAIPLDDLRVVTFGCGITLPRRFPHLQQFVGTLDMLGRFNTPRLVMRNTGFHWVRGTGHNLNEANPFHTPIGDHLPLAAAPIPLPGP